MSEAKKSEHAILLPEATIHLFVDDPQTLTAAKAMDEDWRFARVSVSVREGGLNAAVHVYKDEESPSLIILETNYTGDDLTEKLAALSAHCREGTAAIVIGPVNDVDLYRNLTAMGVSDYLVRPVPEKTLSNVIAKTLIDQLGTGESQLVAVLGSQGGVGASTVAQIIASSFSGRHGQKTFLLDAAGGWSSLPLKFGFDPVAKINEAIKIAENKDYDSLKRIVFDAGNELHILAGGADPLFGDNVGVFGYENLLNMIMANYPVVIVDLSGCAPELKKSVLAKAGHTILVSTANPAALRAARMLIKESKAEKGGSDDTIHVVINKTGMAPGQELSKGDLKEALDMDVDLLVPFDPKVFLEAEAQAKPVQDIKGGQIYDDKFLPLLSSFIKKKKTSNDEAAEKDGFINKIMKKLGA